MALTNGRLPTVDRVLSSARPPLLFHYTSPTGLIGIAQSKVLWATHVKFLNDAKELGHAVDLARSAIDYRLGAPTFAGHYAGPEQVFLQYLDRYAGTASSDIYVASLSRRGDQLSQWRAYCPPGGGYSIGFSSVQLDAVAASQNFFLSPCVYDHDIQSAVVNEIIDCQLSAFRQRLANSGGAMPSEEIERLAVEASREFSRYGPMLKHHSFDEEQEWRLIGSSRGVSHPSIRYRAGKNSVIPYLEFQLCTNEHPDVLRKGHDDMLTVMIGPTRDREAAFFAVQSLGDNAFPPGWSFGSTGTPYRAS